ncbi:2,3-bisphosphoglycerate-dependent phosphoglycerate mutase [Bartonella sp. DGB1]|uniref:2,3-bisphosphoglycerate-dependent phosphoglycerate mutase n=1 Tax=Bartonella sp. DGB1 TaxID=3239807 RepID=UPI003525951B
MTNKLILIRHGQSEWNLKNLFTGWKDPDLTATGIEETKKAAFTLKKENIIIEKIFTSDLLRAKKTAQIIMSENNITAPLTSNKALNERDYGDLAGLNKDEAKKKWGEQQIYLWRRSYEIAPPGGESLKDTVSRVLPYYLHNIQPHVLNGKITLVAAHGNSLRALIMALEGLTAEEILKQEIATAVPIVYEIAKDSTIVTKKILT